MTRDEVITQLYFDEGVKKCLKRFPEIERDDQLQEAIIKIWRMMESGKWKTPFKINEIKAYLITILVNSHKAGGGKAIEIPKELSEVEDEALFERMIKEDEILMDLEAGIIDEKINIREDGDDGKFRFPIRKRLFLDWKDRSIVEISKTCDVQRKGLVRLKKRMIMFIQEEYTIKPPKKQPKKKRV